VRRLAEEVRRRLEPVERVLPVKLPGYEGGERAAAGSPTRAAEQAAAPAPQHAAARIDAARERLRATIAPPADPHD
jgi:hypothetical protein